MDRNVTPPRHRNLVQALVRPNGPAVPTPFPHQLFVWLSPAFPSGAFAYSHGLEMAAERHLITDRVSLEDWLSALITHGSLRNDLILLAAAHRATTEHDPKVLAAVNALALALQPSAERYLETTQQGGSFLIGIIDAWPHEIITRQRGTLDGALAYPVAVGLATAAHTIPLDVTLCAFAFAFITNLTSAAIRLSLVGQTDAQVIIAALSLKLQIAAGNADASTLDDISSATVSADLCSLEHETQYSRLFRS